MTTFIEPTPRKPQLTDTEQRAIIQAALEQLHPAIFEIRPDPKDAMTLAQHLEMIVFDSMRDSYAVDAVQLLFQAMSEAAAARMLEIVADR